MVNDRQTTFYCVSNVGFSVSGVNTAPKFYRVLGLNDLFLGTTEVSYSVALQPTRPPKVKGGRVIRISCAACLKRLTKTLADSSTILAVGADATISVKSTDKGGAYFIIM